MFLAGFCFAECVMPAFCKEGASQTIYIRQGASNFFRRTIPDIRGYLGNVEVRGIRDDVSNITAYIDNSYLTVYGRVPRKSDEIYILVHSVYDLKGADLNKKSCDERIDDADLLNLLFNFGDKGKSSACLGKNMRFTADVNADGVVDDVDLERILLQFGFGEEICKEVRCGNSIRLRFLRTLSPTRR